MTFPEWLAQQRRTPDESSSVNFAGFAFLAGYSAAKEAQSKNSERYEALRTLHCLPTKKFNSVIARVSNSPDGAPDGFDNRADAVIAALAAEGL